MFVLRGAAKQPTEGKAAITDAESTAEGLVLADYGMRSAAKAMAIKVKAWRTQHAAATEPLVVVQGSQAPSIAQWQSFNRMSAELERELKLVAQDWKTVTAGSAGGGGGTKLGTFIAPTAVGAVISTISSLLKTDYGVTGTKLAPTADAMRAIIIGALSDEQIPLKLPEFQVAGEPTAVKTRLDELAPLQKAASALYHDDYLKRLAAAGGKPDKLDAAIASAGANLATALADYDALVKALYTPVAAVLPAVEIERQRSLAGAKQPFLYVTSFTSTLSAVTKKGLFTGIRSTPASLRVASTIDFKLAAGTDANPGKVVVVTPVVAFDKAAEYQNAVAEC